MRKPQDNSELFIGLFTFCKKFKLNYYRVRYKIIKCRMRIFLFNGITYVEVNNLKDLARSNPKLFGVSVSSIIDYLETLV